jgi:hypothetical protein
LAQNKNKNSRKMTTENNKIIAKFMGATLTKDLQIMYPVYEGDSSYVKDLKYHLDWNWLMEVVEKIESILPDDSIITIEYKNCFIPVLDDEEPFTIEGGGKTKIEAVYNACLEFIKWYNENSAKEK